MRWIVALVIMSAVAAACAADAPTASAPGLVVADGFVAEVIVEGLDRPTQLAAVGDGTHVVAQLAGGEKDGVGTVERLDLDTGETTTIVDGLLTPTGVAVRDDELWIMEQRTLSVGPLDGSGERTVVADGLPFNGRSQGTLTVVDDMVFFDTSGRRAGADAADGSGRLFAVDAAGGIAEWARGFKHAYAHAPAEAGELWVTEMSDGRYDGEPANDELVRLREGADGGWPQCVGDRVPVAEFGGTAQRCAAAVASHALFPPSATPTSVAVAPWDGGATVLVALWVRGEVVTVPSAAPAGQPHEPTTILTGLERPQHLLVDDEGAGVYVVDHASGSIVRISPEG